jgi:cytoskeletal protein RodZ
MTMATTPREFGAALRAARERRQVRLDTIAERTKIGRRLLEALEAGEFAKLPNRVFVRLFLQQYLQLVGEGPEAWMASFDAAWQRFEDASQPWEVAPPAPGRAARAMPWVIGAVVVAAGFAALLLLDRGVPDGGSSPAPPTPAALLPVAASPAPPAGPAPAPAPEPTPTIPPTPADVLVMRAVGRPCWVEVRVDGAPPQSRLLAADEELRIAVGGRAVDLLAGDAGALRVEYLGEVRERAGGDGQVARLRLGPGPASGEAGRTP